MGIFVTAPDDESRVASMGAMNPLALDGSDFGIQFHYPGDGMRPRYIDKITGGWVDDPWVGTIDAAAKGIVSGLTDVARTAGAAMDAAFGPNPLADPNDDSLQRVQDWAKISPYTHGTNAEGAGNFVHGLTTFGLGSLLGGPVAGAATTAATSGYGDYRESIAAGVDPKTAAEKAGVTAAFAGAGAFLPFKFGGAGVGGLVKSVVGGAAINTGFGVADRIATSELLKSAGYDHMAAQYHDLDAQAMAADAILGMAFGGFAHLVHGANVPAAERPNPSEVQDALDARRNEMVARGAGGVPVDAATATLDAKLQDSALENMLRRQPVETSPEDAASVVRGSLADPERLTLNHDYDQAGVAVHGDLADFGEPPRLTDAIEPYPAPPAGDVSGPRQGATASASDLGPAAQSSLDQLALRHPDLEVQAPDGRTVKASELPDALAQDRELTAQSARLIDAAVGCFMRTIA